MRPFLCLLASGLLTGLALASDVFDNQNTLPATPGGTATSGPASFGFNAIGTRELGDYVILGGTDRLLTNVNVPMAIFAPSGGSQPGNPFLLPITLNIYAVDTSGANAAPGALLNSITQNFNIPGVPSGSGNRVYFNIDFSAIGLNITLPNSFIWSIAYDATNPNSPQASLNTVVADVEPSTPGIGSYGDPNAIFIDSEFVNGGGFQRGTFLVDIGFFVRPTARFTAIPEPSTFVLLGAMGAAALFLRRRR